MKFVIFYQENVPAENAINHVHNQSIFPLFCVAIFSPSPSSALSAALLLLNVLSDEEGFTVKIRKRDVGGEAG